MGKVNKCCPDLGDVISSDGTNSEIFLKKFSNMNCIFAQTKIFLKLYAVIIRLELLTGTIKVNNSTFTVKKVGEIFLLPPNKT